MKNLFSCKCGNIVKKKDFYIKGNVCRDCFCLAAEKAHNITKNNISAFSQKHNKKHKTNASSLDGHWAVRV